MNAWLRTCAVLHCCVAVGLAACSPDDEGGTTAVGASAGMGGDGENEAGGGTNARGGSPEAGGADDEAGAGNGTGQAGSGSSSSVRERFARAMCHAYLTCAEARKDFLVDLLGGEDPCVPFMEHSLDLDAARREQFRLIEAGAVDLDESALTTCLDLWNSCVFDSRLAHEACRRAIAGRAGIGEPCHSSAECTPDSYCRADDASADDACAGTCAALKPAASACASTEECASDGGYYRCEKESGSSTGTCQAVTVKTELAVGVDCGTTAVGTEAACGSKLWCNDSDSRCAEPIAHDEPCVDDRDVCELGHFCAGPEGSKTCLPVTVVSEEDASCDDDQLVLCNVTLGLGCVDGTCQKIGDGDAGTGCGVDSLNCNIGLYCDGDSDTCQPRLAASSPCTSGRQCQSGICDASKVCAAEYCGVR